MNTSVTATFFYCFAHKRLQKEMMLLNENATMY